MRFGLKCFNRRARLKTLKTFKAANCLFQSRQWLKRWAEFQRLAPISTTSARSYFQFMREDVKQAKRNTGGKPDP
jgi:hypothetical protein